jgi:hydrogenase maturation protease
MKPGKPVLVIGYGNTLRGDDAAGPQVAERVASWGLQHVQARAVLQLTPELAESLAGAGLAIFVDAYPAAEGGAVQVQPLEPSVAPDSLDHRGDPRWLLALARAVHGDHPPAWWLLVPGIRFELGEGLSSTAAGGVDAALRRITLMVRDKSERRL